MLYEGVKYMDKSINFCIYKDELKGVEKFQHDHEKCFKSTAIGGQFTFSFTPTGIGIVTTIKCSICKEEKTLTDFSLW